MSNNRFLRTIPRLPFSVLLWAALAVLLLIGLEVGGQKYHWSDDLITTLRTLIVLLIGLRIIAVIKRALAESRADLLTRIAMGEEAPLEVVSWKDSVTGVYLIHILLYAGLVLLVIFAVGGTLSGFLVSGTLLSVMLGVAGQSFFANFFGGLAIAIFKPFELGDHVQLVAWQLPVMAETYPHETRSQGYRGFIRDINLFFSEIRLDDGRVMRIPNGVMINAGIVQMHQYEWLRTSFRFDVSLKGDAARMLEAIREAAARHFPAGEDPAATVAPSALSAAASAPAATAARAPGPVGAHAVPGGGDQALYWHPAEVLVVDINLTAVSVEVQASVLHRHLQARKSEFLREVMCAVSAPVP